MTIRLFAVRARAYLIESLSFIYLALGSPSVGEGCWRGGFGVPVQRVLQGILDSHTGTYLHFGTCLGQTREKEKPLQSVIGIFFCICGAYLHAPSPLTLRDAWRLPPSHLSASVCRSRLQQPNRSLNHPRRPNWTSWWTTTTTTGNAAPSSSA